MSSAVQTTVHAGKPSKVTHVKKGLPPEIKTELKSDPANTEPEVLVGEVITGFDYDSIQDPELRKMAQDAAERIAQNNRTIETKVLDTGRTLIAFKEAIKRKDKLFGDWIKAACPFSYKTALNYMAVAREFGDDYPLLAYIPSQMLYPLASRKDLGEARSVVMEAAKDGNPIPVPEIEKLMSQGKAADEDGSKAEVRKTTAAKAMAWLEARDGYGDFLALVREAGREFTIALNTAAKEAA